MTDPRDVLLQNLTPVIPVPRFSPLAPMEKPGHRYLLARDGLWLEVYRPWIHGRVPLATCEFSGEHRLPFGELEQSIEYRFGAEDLQRLQALFAYDACKTLPNEAAAWGVYDEKSGRLEYRALLADAASATGITFQRPRLADHEHLAVDIHSHGAGPAGFSTTDDRDDLGEVKISLVAGGLGGQVEWESRLCLLGVYVPGEERFDEEIEL